MKVKVFLALAAVLASATLSYAVAIPSAGTSLGTASPTPFKPSSNVTMDALSDGVHYGVTAVHRSAIGNAGAKGGWQYGTTDQSPSLLRAPAPATGTTPTAATQPDLPNTFVSF